MPMDINEYKKLTGEILKSGGDQGKVSELLTKLVDDYTQTTAEYHSLEQEREDLKRDNQSLRDSNVRLFLKVGGGSDDKQDQQQQQQDDEPKITIADLFDENGDWKHKTKK